MPGGNNNTEPPREDILVAYIRYLARILAQRSGGGGGGITCADACITNLAAQIETANNTNATQNTQLTTLTDAIAIINANYVTTAALATALSSYVTSASLSTTLASYVTSSLLSSTLSGYVTTAAQAAALAVLESDLSVEINDKIPLAQKGAASGVAPLDGSVKLNVSYMPPLPISQTTGLQAALDAKIPIPSQGYTDSASAPASPANGHVWVERDGSGNIIQTWVRDGTNNRWLTRDFYYAGVTNSATAAGSGTLTSPASFPAGSTAIYISYAEVRYSNSAVQNGTNNFTFQPQYVDAARANQTLTSFPTNPTATTNTMVTASASLNVTVAANNFSGFRRNETATGTPGTLQFVYSVRYQGVR